MPGSKPVKFAQATCPGDDGIWELAENPVWNIPNGVSRVPFEILYLEGEICAIKGVAISSDGKVFGERSLSNFRVSGHVHEGQVGIAGKKYRAFTESRTFKRPDGSCVQVDELYICGYPATPESGHLI